MSMGLFFLEHFFQHFVLNLVVILLNMHMYLIYKI